MPKYRIDWYTDEVVQEEIVDVIRGVGANDAVSLEEQHMASRSQSQGLVRNSDTLSWSVKRTSAGSDWIDT